MRAESTRLVCGCGSTAAKQPKLEAFKSAGLPAHRERAILVWCFEEKKTCEALGLLRGEGLVCPHERFWKQQGGRSLGELSSHLPVHVLSTVTTEQGSPHQRRYHRTRGNDPSSPCYRRSFRARHFAAYTACLPLTTAPTEGQGELQSLLSIEKHFISDVQKEKKYLH